MQLSNEGYAVQLYDLDSVSVCSESQLFVESMGVENGNTAEASDEIAYLLFGALTKKVRGNVDEKQVLIKAEVVLKRRREQEATLRQIGWLSFRRFWAPLR